MDYEPQAVEFVYIFGPYSGTSEEIEANIRHAEEVSVILNEMGFGVICPHLLTAHFERICKASYDHYMNVDLALLSICHKAVGLRGWRNSNGSNIEHKHCLETKIPMFFEEPEPGQRSLSEITISPTITKYPNQCREFNIVLGKMMRTHLEKNEDYSPANVQGPGMLGIATRMWDKAVRLCNLSGVDVQVTKSEIDILLLLFIAVLDVCRKTGIKIHAALVYTGVVKQAKFEKKEDNFIDLAVYCVIGFLNFLGFWGR